MTIYTVQDILSPCLSKDTPHLTRRVMGQLRELSPDFSLEDWQTLENTRSLVCGYGATDFELTFVVHIFKRLSRLTVRFSEYVTHRALEHLRRLPELQELTLENCKNLSDESLTWLTGLKIRKLILRSNAWLKCENLQFLPRRTLKELEIVNCRKINEFSLAAFRDWSIQVLTLDSRCISVVSIDELKRIPALRKLVLNGGEETEYFKSLLAPLRLEVVYIPSIFQK